MRSGADRGHVMPFVVREWIGKINLAHERPKLQPARADETELDAVVLPDSDLKIFLDASVGERARRRAEERGIKQDGPERREILAQLRRRDELDRNRAVAPLRPAPDAHILKTDGNAFEQTVAMVVQEIAGAEPARSSRAGARA